MLSHVIHTSGLDAYDAIIVLCPTDTVILINLFHVIPTQKNKCAFTFN